MLRKCCLELICAMFVDVEPQSTVQLVKYTRLWSEVASKPKPKPKPDPDPPPLLLA